MAWGGVCSRCRCLKDDFSDFVYVLQLQGLGIYGFEYSGRCWSAAVEDNSSANVVAGCCQHMT